MKGKKVIQMNDGIFDKFIIQELVNKAESNNSNAQACLGYVYEEGLCGKIDFSKAIEWYTKSAEQGNIFAQINLGHIYNPVEGTEENLIKSFEWYKKAAEQGNPDAQFLVASILYHPRYSKVIESDITKRYGNAFEWCKKATEQNNAYAQYTIAYCYRQGLGCKKSYKNSTLWNTKAKESLTQEYLSTLDLLNCLPTFFIRPPP